MANALDAQGAVIHPETITVNQGSGANSGNLLAGDNPSSVSSTLSVTQITDAYGDSMTPTNEGTLVRGAYGTLNLADSNGQYTYTPTVTGLSIGQTDTDTFAFQVSDSGTGQAQNETLTVTIDGPGPVSPTPTPPSAPPPTPPTLTISGTHPTTDSAEQTVTPFSGVTVSNSAGNATTTVTIAPSGAAGTLAGTGLFNQQDGTYTVSGDLNTVNSELQALTFTPTNGTPGAQVLTNFALTASSGGGMSSADTGTSVLDTAMPPYAPAPTENADYLIGGPGPSLISALQGNDSVVGGASNDSLYGGMGADTLQGQQGADLLLGNRGNDVLFGGMGNDTLYGGKGNDILIGGKGDDLLFGNEGNDTFAFHPGDTDFRSMLSTGDTIGDFATGADKIDFTAGPIGTATDFASASTTSTDFAQIQTLAQTLLSGSVSYAFVADGTDGFLFTNGGNGQSTPTDAIKLVGAGTTASLAYTDIAHHPVV